MPEASPEGSNHDALVRGEFARAAATFATRTQGRFDHMNVVEFARVPSGATVVELGAGTGNFLSLFSEVAGRLIAVDITEEMLREARGRFANIETVLADARRTPLASRSIDLVTSAQAFHHMHDAPDVLKEMRRVVAPDGLVLVVDQVAPEKVEEVVVMHELEVTRDPSHAATRPRSAFRTMMQAAGLEVIDERISEQRQSFDRWMTPEEFPPERIAAVRDFIERYGAETGMDFTHEGDQTFFTRRRIMLLARRVGP